MQTRPLGRSTLEVTVAGLGCNNFGDPLDAEESAAVVRRSLDLGVRFFDTADAYGNGASETFLGAALGRERDGVVVASKFGSELGGDIASAGGARPEYIRRALDATLTRLGTDHLDLYQLHEPDPATPLDDTLACLEDLRTAGKIRAYGVCNLSSQAVIERTPRWSIASNQTMWNLLFPDFAAASDAEWSTAGASAIPWFPLAGGLLTGKYSAEDPRPAGSRYARMWDRLSGLATPSVFDKVERIRATAARYEVTMVELSLAWLTSHACVATVIAGAMNPEQHTQNVAALTDNPTPPGALDEIADALELKRKADR